MEASKITFNAKCVLIFFKHLLKRLKSLFSEYHLASSSLVIALLESPSFSFKGTIAEKCQYSELFRTAFSRNWTKYGEIRYSGPHFPVRMQENADQNNAEWGHFHVLNVK